MIASLLSWLAGRSWASPGYTHKPLKSGLMKRDPEKWQHSGSYTKHESLALAHPLSWGQLMGIHAKRLSGLKQSGLISKSEVTELANTFLSAGDGAQVASKRFVRNWEGTVSCRNENSSTILKVPSNSQLKEGIISHSGVIWRNLGSYSVHRIYPVQQLMRVMMTKIDKRNW